MKHVTAFLLVLLLLTVLLFLQEQQLLSLAGANPNLMLIGLLAVVFSGHPKRSRRFFLTILGLGLIGISTIWFPFWLAPIASLILLTLLIDCLTPLSTGNAGVDFLLGIALLTIVFYAIQGSIVVGELIYNLIIGSVFLITTMSREWKRKVYA